MKTLGCVETFRGQFSIDVKLELYLPYAPLPGGGGILPAVSSAGSCRPVLLGGVDLSMSAAVQPTNGPHSTHHPAGISLPSLTTGPVIMPRPPNSGIPTIGTAPSHHHESDIGDAPPNPDVLLALLARNKNLEGKCDKI